MKQQMASTFPAAVRAETRAEKLLEGLRYEESRVQAWPPEKDIEWLIEYVHLKERQARKAANQRKALANLNAAYDCLRLRVVVYGQVNKFRGLIKDMISWMNTFNTETSRPGYRVGRDWVDKACNVLYRDRI